MKKYGYFSVVAGFVLIGIPVTLSSNEILNSTRDYSSQARIGEKGSSAVNVRDVQITRIYQPMFREL